MAPVAGADPAPNWAVSAVAGAVLSGSPGHLG